MFFAKFIRKKLGLLIFLGIIYTEVVLRDKNLTLILFAVFLAFTFCSVVYSFIYSQTGEIIIDRLEFKQEFSVFVPKSYRKLEVLIYYDGTKVRITDLRNIIIDLSGPINQLSKVEQLFRIHGLFISNGVFIASFDDIQQGNYKFKITSSDVNMSSIVNNTSYLSLKVVGRN